MPVPRQKRRMFFCVIIKLVAVIAHWKEKNQNNNGIMWFDKNPNLIDKIDEDTNDNYDITNECLGVTKPNNNNKNKTKDEKSNALQLIKIK